MRLIRWALMGMALIIANAASGEISEQNELTPARLIRSGYMMKDGEYVSGPEDSDQVWAEWLYRSCKSGAARRIYVRRLLVHSIKFPRPGGIYLLSMTSTGAVAAAREAHKNEKVPCGR